jgi:predicted nucleic acid-binding protein
VTAGLAYLDTSAYVKLPLREPEEVALRGELAEFDGYVSSALLGVEAIRACARYGRRYAKQARAWLFDVALLPVDDSLLDQATAIEPVGLRSLDAIHLATALSIRDDIGAFFTFDRRLAESAAEHGLSVMPNCMT